MNPSLQRLLEHRSELVAYLRRQGATAAEADDVLQSALARGLEPWAELPAAEQVVPWFYRVLHNALIDQARRSAAAGRALERYAHEPSEASAETERRRICRCTRRVLASLKPEYAQLIELVDVDGVAVDDAARRVGITANNAYVRLHRARKALRERLAGVCGECATDAGGCNDCYCQPDGPV